MGNVATLEDFQGEYFDDLLDDNSPNDSNEIDQETEDPHQENPVNGSDDSNDGDSEVNQDSGEESSDYISKFLKNYGIENKTIEFEDDDGNTSTVSFDELNDDEKFNILNELVSNNLTDDEIATINYLRNNKATLQDVIEYYSNKAIEDYINKNGEVEKKYSIDDYTDDEIYLADLKAKYGDMSDEEIRSDLESAKENEALFKKKVDAIRKQYKEQEDEAERAALKEQEDRYNSYKQTIHDTLDNFNEISMDYKNSESESFEVEPADKEAIFSYLLDQDQNGHSQFFKDLNDPSKLIKIGFYALYGDEIISNITNYWKEQLKSSRREDNKPTTTVVKKPQNKDSFSKIHRHSAEIAYGDDFL